MWRVVENRAHLRLPPLAALLDLLRPDLGLGELSLNDCPHQQAHLLQVRCPQRSEPAPPGLQDHYVRGTDLIACYQPGDDPELTTQLYWRGIAVDSPASGGVELIVSVQTSRLDSEPRLAIGSQLPVEQVLHLADAGRPEFQPLEFTSGAAESQQFDGCSLLLHRLPASPYSYVEMIHPDDGGPVVVAQTPGAEAMACSQFQLFHEHLEKGVIRRGRMRGVFVPRQDDRNVAWRCYRQFVESPLPLTT